MSQVPSSQTTPSNAQGTDKNQVDPPGIDTVVDVEKRMEQTVELLDDACEFMNRDDRDQFDLTIIVPVYNERETLPNVIDRIFEVMAERTEVIVVDDASTDGTSQWLRQLPSDSRRRAILRNKNHGKGSAVRLGIRHSRGAVVAIQDADTEYDPADLIDVVEPILEGHAEVVYGSRYLAGDGDPSKLHRLGNWALTAISNCMTGQELTDMETCHKAFRGDLIRSVALRECRFGFEPEITGKVAALGVEIEEVPTGYEYRSYAEGKKITWRDGVAAMACMWRYRNPGWVKRAFLGSGRVIGRSISLLKTPSRR